VELCSSVLGECEGTVGEDIQGRGEGIWPSNVEDCLCFGELLDLTEDGRLAILSVFVSLTLGDNGFYPTLESSPLQEHTPVTSLTLDADIGT